MIIGKSIDKTMEITIGEIRAKKSKAIDRTIKNDFRQDNRRDY